MSQKGLEDQRNLHSKATIYIFSFSALFCYSCQFYRLFFPLMVGMTDRRFRSEICIVVLHCSSPFGMQSHFKIRVQPTFRVQISGG